MFQFSLSNLSGEADAHPYRGMTFPRFVGLLRGAGSNRSVFAVVGTQDGGPEDGRESGLALAFKDPASAGAELLSLYVRPEVRGRGLGRALLARLEADLARAGAASLASVYMTRLASVDAFESILRAREWSPPTRRMLVFRTRRERLREADWFDAHAELPPGVSIIPWSQVSGEARAALRRSLDEIPDRAPPDVHPFAYEGAGVDDAESEPALSLACLMDGRIVGWNLAHRVSAHMVRFSCSYVYPEARERMPLLALWDHAFHRLEAAGYTHVSWAVSPRHEAMVKFNEQVLLPYVDDFDETRGSAKLLYRVST